MGGSVARSTAYVVFEEVVDEEGGSLGIERKKL